MTRSEARRWAADALERTSNVAASVFVGTVLVVLWAAVVGGALVLLVVWALTAFTTEHGRWLLPLSLVVAGIAGWCVWSTRPIRKAQER